MDALDGDRVPAWRACRSGAVVGGWASAPRRPRSPARQPAAPRIGGEGEPGPARSGRGQLPRHRRPHAAASAAWSSARSACSSGWSSTPSSRTCRCIVDARDLRADLRDLQDLPDPAGQVPADSLAVHRRHHRASTSARCMHFTAVKVAVILFFSLVGIAGSYGVAWFGIRVNTFANSRTAFAALARQAVSLLRDSAQGRHEHRHDADQRRAAAHADHPAVHPGRLRGPVLHRLRDRRVARRRGAAHRRRHLHEDRRHRRRPDEDRLQDQGRRRAQSGRHRRLHGRQRRRLGRPVGRRLRDLRRHRRRADLVHPARRRRRHRCRSSCWSGSS